MGPRNVVERWDNSRASLYPQGSPYQRFPEREVYTERCRDTDGIVWSRSVSRWNGMESRGEWQFERNE